MAELHPESQADALDYTDHARKSMHDVVNNRNFRKNDDVKLIYHQLEEKIALVPFGDYLKRYIYQKAEPEENSSEIPLQEYVNIIRSSFIDNGVPPSFTHTTAKLSAQIKNWLTQQTVQRNVVFLLGFGLKMSMEDVEDFLTKALHEPRINPKNPFEVICCYCYRNGLNFSQYEKLWHMYETISDSSAELLLENTAGTVRVMTSLNSEDTLLLYLSKLKDTNGESHISRSSKKYFETLYNEARRLIAEIYNQINSEEYSEKLHEYHSKLLVNDRLYDCDRQKKLDHYKENRKILTYEDISPSDIERMLYADVPFDKNGNLISGKTSTLNHHFLGKRFSRQHINAILTGITAIDRFDLITLNFLIYALRIDEIPSINQRYRSFTASTNNILTNCNMGELYVANPYENFILMCILSEYPLGTYTEVFGMSYKQQQN